MQTSFNNGAQRSAAAIESHWLCDIMSDDGRINVPQPIPTAVCIQQTTEVRPTPTRKDGFAKKGKQTTASRR